MTDPISPQSNAAELSVSELAASIKRTIEGAYGYVRVRGELGRVTRAASGHMYLDLKDERAVLSGVIWKGSAQKLKIEPEQGLEVVAVGRLTTFAGQSRYQIVIERLEPAGVGALMALLEARKKKLAQEGLFEDARKQALPYLPSVIGVVTSPTGAVIRDILHRLRDRFPTHVVIWPTLVQGDKAAEQVAAGIRGFNALAPGGAIARPDLIIVARGGGSIEDLWPFNEESVVRAAAESDIPLISAVGHETDTTLIDFASDMRAPTPSAAAELATPVRAELGAGLADLSRRLWLTAARLDESRRQRLDALARGLGRPEDLLAMPQQRLDAAGGRLSGALAASLHGRERVFADIAARLRPAGERRISAAAARLAAQPLRPALLSAQHRRGHDALIRAADRLGPAGRARLDRLADRLNSAAKLLSAVSYESVLSRGFAVARTAEGAVISSASAARGAAEIEFHDGRVGAVFGDGGAPQTGPAEGERKPSGKKPAKKAARQEGGAAQTDLFDGAKK